MENEQTKEMTSTISPWNIWEHYDDGWRCKIIELLIKQDSASFFDILFRFDKCDIRRNRLIEIRELLKHLSIVNSTGKKRFSNSGSEEFYYKKIQMIKQKLKPSFSDYMIFTYLFEIGERRSMSIIANIEQIEKLINNILEIINNDIKMESSHGRFYVLANKIKHIFPHMSNKNKIK